MTVRSVEPRPEEVNDEAQLLVTLSSLLCSALLALGGGGGGGGVSTQQSSTAQTSKQIKGVGESAAVLMRLLLSSLLWR